MSRPNALVGFNTVLSVVALLSSAAAIGLYLFDPRDGGGSEPERAEEAEGEASNESGDAPPPLAVGENGAVQTADVAGRCLPSVVNISTTRVVQGPEGNPFFDVFRRFFGLGDPTPQEAQSLGSGVIVSESGTVLTNHHVVANASEIRVTLSDGREVPAQLVGSDPESDVAVLRLRTLEVDVTPLPYGDSAALRQGDVVLAIGNPFGVGQTVTMGIVSAVGRASMGITDYEDFIQTDAAINPGNSGGALVNLRGELVGINTAILSRTGGSHGIGFAIPSNMARPIAEALLRDGEVTRGWLGVTAQDLTSSLARSMGLSSTHGVAITAIDPRGPAASVDLRPGDVITRIGAERIRSSRQLRNVVATRGAGATLQVTRLRGGSSAEVEVTLVERPTPSGTGDAADTSGATDVGGLLVRELDAAMRSRYAIASDVSAGAVIVGVRDNSPGAGAGVAPGDVVVEINFQPVSSPEQLAQAYEQSVFVASLRVRRGSQSRIVILRR